MNERKQKRKQNLKAAVSALIIAALFAGCQAGEQGSSSEPVSEASPHVFTEGMSMEGQDISGKTPQEAIDIGKSYIENRLKKLEISIAFLDETVMLKDSDFTYKEMLHITVPKLLENKVTQDISIPYVVDLSETGREKIFEAAKNCFVQAKDSTVEGFDGEFQFSQEVEGKKVDIDKTLKNLRQLIMRKQSGALQAEFMTVSPTITKAELQEKFGQVASFTTVSTNSSNGNSNMALALSRLDGTKLEPGEVFSYNRTIGDSSSAAEGYLPAGGISGGVIVQMYGGGICQASTTLYNAVIRAGLEIVERECHGIESSYVPTGLDAMVDSGGYDFRFRNNTKYPIYVQGWMDGTTLYAAIYGVHSEEWDRIETSSSRVDTVAIPSEVSFTEDASLAKGEYVLASSGRQGVHSVASRHFYKNGELVRTEALPNSYYPAKGRIYTYGPGTDKSKIDTTKDHGNVEEKPSPSPSPTPAVTPTPPPAATPTPAPVTPAPTPTPEPAPTPPPETTPAPTPTPSPADPPPETESSNVSGI